MKCALAENALKNETTLAGKKIKNVLRSVSAIQIMNAVKNAMI